MQPARKIPHCVKLFTTLNKVLGEKLFRRCKNFKFQSRHPFVLLLFYWRCNATRTRLLEKEFFLCVLGIPTGATWKIAMTCFFPWKTLREWIPSWPSSHCIAYLFLWSIYSSFLFLCILVDAFQFPYIIKWVYTLARSIRACCCCFGEESRAACVYAAEILSVHSLCVFENS